MRRKLLLIGVPLLVLAAWGISGIGTGADAQVDISAPHPTELRGAVVAAVTAAGGVRTGEDTSYDGRGSSQLTFNVPTARIEDAIGSLDGLGGTITDQRIDLSSAADAAGGVTQKVTDAQSCLNNLSGALGSSQARTQLSQCRSQLSTALGQLGSSKVDLTTSQLVVKITPSGASNPALVVAIILLVTAAIGMAILVWRSSRLRPSIDLRELAEFETEDDLHLRRN